MPRAFQVPTFYRSPYISLVKKYRQAVDPRKRDLSPTILDFGPVRFKIGRHFGFCFGVENAIEIAYRAITENTTKRIFLLSEMIHNPEVNRDLQERGVRFLMNTDGSVRIPFSELTPDDIVIVPAFGTTLELQAQLATTGIDPYYYDTTCPFVKKVWKRSAELGTAQFSVIIHGRRAHEETRATFSHSARESPTIIVRDMADTEYLIQFLKGEVRLEQFAEHFAGAMSEGFDPLIHLKRVGVVNQTTMLASETQAIARRIRETMAELYGARHLAEHFADTRDTLCYATNENQTATQSLLAAGADLAIVVGGYNSSNTSHLVELAERVMPTYYIRDYTEIIDHRSIRHFVLEKQTTEVTSPWFPENRRGAPVDIALISGASCPDSTVDQVLQRILGFFTDARDCEEVFRPFAELPNSSPAL